MKIGTQVRIKETQGHCFKLGQVVTLVKWDNYYGIGDFRGDWWARAGETIDQLLESDQYEVLNKEEN